MLIERNECRKFIVKEEYRIGGDMVPYVPSVKTMLKGWLVLVLKNKLLLNSLFLLIVYILVSIR